MENQPVQKNFIQKLPAHDIDWWWNSSSWAQHLNCVSKQIA